MYLVAVAHEDERLDQRLAQRRVQHRRVRLQQAGDFLHEPADALGVARSHLCRLNCPASMPLSGKMYQ